MSAQPLNAPGTRSHYAIALVAALLIGALFAALSLSSFDDVALRDAVPIEGDDDPWARRVLIPAELVGVRLPPGTSLRARPYAGATFSACKPAAIIESVSRLDEVADSRVARVRLVWRSQQQRQACLALAGAPFAVALPAGKRSYASLLRHAVLRD